MLDLEVLDTGLDIVFRIDPEHEAGLVETHLVFAGDLYLHLELPSSQCIEKRSIIIR